MYQIFAGILGHDLPPVTLDNHSSLKSQTDHTATINSRLTIFGKYPGDSTLYEYYKKKCWTDHTHHSATVVLSGERCYFDDDVKYSFVIPGPKVRQPHMLDCVRQISSILSIA